MITVAHISRHLSLSLSSVCGQGFVLIEGQVCATRDDEFPNYRVARGARFIRAVILAP